MALACVWNGLQAHRHMGSYLITTRFLAGARDAGHFGPRHFDPEQRLRFKSGAPFALREAAPEFRRV
jgi:hypothetical protein